MSRSDHNRITRPKTLISAILAAGALLALLVALARPAEAHIPYSPANDAGRAQSSIVHRPSSIEPTATPSPTPDCGLAWRIVTSPNAPDIDNTLKGVAAVAPNDVWAVGSSNSRGTRQTLIEHWDGTQWSLVPSPNVVGQDNHLEALTAIAHNDVWAVGNAGDRTLALHWDGATWRIVPSANPYETGNYINAAAAASANDVWMAGYYSDGILYHTMTQHWDGAAWTYVPSLGVEGSNNVFLGMTALAPNNAWAVGLFSMEGVLRTLIEHWDGNQWSIEPSPNVGAWSAVMSLSAVSPTDMWAVGAYSDDSPLQPLVEHWDGSQWQVTSSPSPQGLTTVLSSVSAITESDVWAVGATFENDNPIVQHWDGTQWSIVRSPAQGLENNLNSVVALSSSDVWAVGDFLGGQGIMQTLIEHYSDPCPTNTPTPIATPTSIATSTSTSVPPTVTPTSTVCTISYSDVSPSDYFYAAVQYLSCHGAISGYGDGTFRPYSNTTRGQLCKIVVLAEGWEINTQGGPHFSDVPTTSPFYAYIETAFNRDVIAGYSDSTFRWGNHVTRGQLCKIVVLAEGWPIDTQGGPHFSDVLADHPFYGFIETAYNHGVIAGYADHTFRPGGSATRGQVCKIVFGAVVR